LRGGRGAAAAESHTLSLHDALPILTGGASQLAGLPETARRILARNVRLGRPLGVAGLPEAAKGPAFSTAMGLLIYPQVAAMEDRDRKSTRLNSSHVNISYAVFCLKK